MKRTMLTLCVIATGIVAVAQHREPPPEALAKMGGFVMKPGTPSGSIVVVNAQKKVGAENFDIGRQKVALAKLSEVTKVITGDAATPATAVDLKGKYKADFALFVVDNKELPPSLIAPEEKWAIMNVGALEKGAATPEMVRIRSKNEFARVFAMLCGGFSSQYKAPLTNLVKEPKDLDECLSDLPADMAPRLISYLAINGVRPSVRMPYRVACQQGWAPSPTNDVQKKIWNETFTPPDKPIKIEKKK